jgi:hypothetical protein
MDKTNKDHSKKILTAGALRFHGITIEEEIKGSLGVFE